MPCAPPIRAKEEQTYLWRGLKRGLIQSVSTDHCAFTLEQKDVGRGDFTRIPGGLPGVETRGELLYSFGVEKKKIALPTMCQVLSENPRQAVWTVSPARALSGWGATRTSWCTTPAQAMSSEGRTA